MKKIASDIKNHVLTGISYMIPLVIAGAGGISGNTVHL